MMKSITDFITSLKGKRVLILTHHNADVDAMASAIALKKCLEMLGSAAEIGVPESVSKLAQSIFGDEAVINPDCGKYDAVITVDCSSDDQLKGVKNLRVDAVIDHHPPGNIKAKISFIDPSSRSTSQMVYNIIKKLNCVNREIQEAIALGIITDTAHLRLADRKVFSVLADLDVEFPKLFKKLETTPDISERVANIKAAKRMDIYKFGDVLVVFSVLGSHEAVACRNLVKLGADIAVVFAKKKDELRISSRGRGVILKYGIDLSEIFTEVGKFIQGSGGGHNLAGSANGKPVKIEDVKRFILRLLSKKLGRYRRLK
ncbi:MAG: hypothetical protein GXO63_02815 [Candidatus Micrarchaeota archaeon]|nr:hypothetical protein [Candidatus Micrarchaeota archaeon]